MKMRYAADIVTEIKKKDPGSAVTERMIRRLVKKGVIPSVDVGNGSRKLLDMDEVMKYLENPSQYRDNH